MPRPVRVALAAVLPVLVLGLAACTPAQPLPLISGTATAPAPSPSATPGLAAQAVATVAQRAVGEGTVVAVDDESAGRLWDVRLVLDDGSASEVHLDTAGRVVAGPSSTVTDDDTRSANRAIVAATAVNLRVAADRMRAAVPRGTITAIELTRYRDRVVWQGDVTNSSGVRQDVRIDAVNGSVLLNQADKVPEKGGS